MGSRTRPHRRRPGALAALVLGLVLAVGLPVAPPQGRALALQEKGPPGKNEESGKPAGRGGEEDAGHGAGGHRRRKPNRLIHEKSPYLLQHAYNPVDWYPWGEEAFAAARASGKPIFLSIGYSTCHWCHVMERESFEDEEIAARLNADFIAIKVDREERPDVDEVYMSAAMALNGRGGWPLSVFITADGKPFFAGTYFPPRDDPRRGIGFLTLLGRVIEAWKSPEQKPKLLEFADRLSVRLAHDVGPRPGPRAWALDDLKAGFDELAGAFDPVHGGFGRAPKFPRTSAIDFLLAYHRLTGTEKALEMATVTLANMADGGIYDHVGRGFHRYSTDRQWLVPHFEKMLYDNALISMTYSGAYRLTGTRRFLSVARGCLEYILGRMRAPGGGFYSAEDADSEGEEGKYYVFDRQEIIEILGEKDGALFADRYGITAGGNFEHGKSVLHIAASIEDLARKTGMSPADVRLALERARLRVLAVREKRVPPLRDDKILADWNGMAISALSGAYEASGDRAYLDAAIEAAEFIESRMMRDGALLHRYRAGEARYPAYLEDHAFLAAGLLDLYEATLDLRWLQESARLTRRMLAQFWDGERGGFFHTGAEHEKLIVRTKDFYDGAVPSGNSVAARCLLRLAAYTGDADIVERAGEMRRLGAALIGQGPTRYPEMLEDAAADLLPRVDVVLVGDAAGVAPLLRRVHARYLPARALVRVTVAEKATVAAEVPWVKDLDAASGPRALVRAGGGAFRVAGTPDALGVLLDELTSGKKSRSGGGK